MEIVDLELAEASNNNKFCSFPNSNSSMSMASLQAGVHSILDQAPEESPALQGYEIQNAHGDENGSQTRNVQLQAQPKRNPHSSNAPSGSDERSESSHHGDGDIASSNPNDGVGNGNLGNDSCEVFCGKIPKFIQEKEVRQLFEKYGKITSFRLLKAIGLQRGSQYRNRGYAFIEYEKKEDGERAIQELDNHEIRENRHIHVDFAKPNLRLFVGNIPKSKDKHELFREFAFRTDGLKEVIIYPNNEDSELHNRGFCFLEYRTRHDATAAKFRLTHTSTKVWGCDVIVDWADPVFEPKPEEMEKVTVLYVRNLSPNITEQDLYQLFSTFGFIDRVKKIKDYAFIHFACRENAAKALESLDGNTEMQDAPINVQWSKPPVEKFVREKILHNREKRMLLVMARRELTQEQENSSRRDASSGNQYQRPREFGDYNQWPSFEDDSFQGERELYANAWNVPFQQRHRNVWTRSTGNQAGDAAPLRGNPNSINPRGFYGDRFDNFPIDGPPSSYRIRSEMGQNFSDDPDFPTLSTALGTNHPSGTRSRNRTRRN